MTLSYGGLPMGSGTPYAPRSAGTPTGTFGQQAGVSPFAAVAATPGWQPAQPTATQPQLGEDRRTKLLLLLTAMVTLLLGLFQGQQSPAVGATGGQPAFTGVGGPTTDPGLGLGWLQNPQYAPATTPNSDKAAFDRAMTFVAKWEGGEVNDKDDRGGHTNLGITQATYTAWLKKKGRPGQSVSKITKEEARQIYYEDYWKATQADELARTNPKLAMAYFNMAVNGGPARADKLLKESGGTVNGYLRATEAFYHSIAKGSQRKFLRGWLNRTSDLRQQLNA